MCPERIYFQSRDEGRRASFRFVVLWIFATNYSFVLSIFSTFTTNLILKLRYGVRWSRYLASAAGAGGTFFEELGLHGAAKTSIKIELFHVCIFNSTIVSDEGPQWPRNLSDVTGTDNGYKKKV